jgi:beta-alanine degradation protein BauB
VLREQIDDLALALVAPLGADDHGRGHGLSLGLRSARGGRDSRRDALRVKMLGMADPTHTDPDKYKVVFENERVRVLEYRDEPGARTSPHDHPDTVMVTLSSFRRRLVRGEDQRDVELEAGQVRWLDAQTHSGENIGETPSHVVFVELKEHPRGATAATLGPSD